MIKKAYCGAQWNGPSQGMIDPVKEVAAAEKRISVGLSTRQKETVELTGGDFEANIAQLAREGEMMKEAGLVSVQSAETTQKRRKRKMEKKTKPARFTNAVPATASQANNQILEFR